MLSVAQSIGRTPAVASCSYKPAFTRSYVSGLVPSARNWRTSSSHPTPISLTENGEEQRPKRFETKKAILKSISKNPDRRKPVAKPVADQWVAHRTTMKKTFPQGWAPPRKLSREAMDGLRALHYHDPEQFTTPVLAEKFRVSPEAVRRILRSKWEPSKEKMVEMAESERKARDEWIVQRRLEEQKAKSELERRSGRVFGVDSTDRLSFR